jgi:hypothetical protein
MRNSVRILRWASVRMMLPLCDRKPSAQEAFHWSNRSYREELKEQAILSITELELKNPVCANLGNRRYPPGFEQLSQASNKGRGSRSGRPGEVGEMASKSGIDQQLLLVVGFCKLEEQDFGGQVKDIGQSQSHQALLELMGDDLDRLSAVMTMSFGRG